MPSATMTSKGQITVPKQIREHLGIDAGDRVAFHVAPDGAVTVEAETIDLRSLRSSLKRNGKRVSLAGMEKAIRRGASGR